MKKPRRRFRDFCEAWQWLHDHPKFRHVPLRPDVASFDGFMDALSVTVVKVDPRTRDYVPEGKKVRGAETVVQLEVGPWEDMRTWSKDQRDNFAEQIAKGNVEMPSHDWKLDSWGPTYEAAILMLARKVLKHYGDYVPCGECFDLGVVSKVVGEDFLKKINRGMKPCPKCRPQDGKIVKMESAR